MKIRLELTLPEKSDPFSAIIRLKKQGKVLRANMVKDGLIVIMYDDRKITEEEIKKVVGLKESTGENLKQIINAR
jgi:hypothetical protein